MAKTDSAKLSAQKVALTDVEPAAVAAITDAAPTGSTPDQRVQHQESDPSKPAKTTFQEDLTTAGQRVINLKWENTQQIIAIAVTMYVLSVCAYIVMFGAIELKQAAFIFLTNIAFLVVGTYFQRTNHTKTGGVGQNEIIR